jgi:hypothetical protein
VEGRRLLATAKTDPVAALDSMDGESALKVIAHWDSAIRRQGIRLHQLQSRIVGEQTLSVIGPALQDRVVKIVGSKMDRAVTLHGIGATLFFRAVLPISDTHAEKARVVALLLGAKRDGTLDPIAVEHELSLLDASLEAYRRIVEGIIPASELLDLSRDARARTSLDHS